MFVVPYNHTPARTVPSGRLFYKFMLYFLLNATPYLLVCYILVLNICICIFAYTSDMLGNRVWTPNFIGAFKNNFYLLIFKNLSHLYFSMALNLNTYLYQNFEFVTKLLILNIFMTLETNLEKRKS